MGSTARGLITGFICRLCSKMNRYVVLIYGVEGERMGLADKINSYLPITVNRHDPLPKTVCLNCVTRLENHTHMLQMIENAAERFQKEKEHWTSSRTSMENEDEEENDIEHHSSEFERDRNETESDYSRDNNNSQV